MAKKIFFKLMRGDLLKKFQPLIALTGCNVTLPAIGILVNIGKQSEKSG